MMKKIALLNLILVILLFGCANAGTSQATDATEPDQGSAPNQPAAVAETQEPAFQDRVTLTPGTDGALTIEEHPMRARETVEGVLSIYEDEPWFNFTAVPSRLTIGEDVYSYFIEGASVEEGAGDQTPNLPNLILQKNDQRVMSIPLGELSTTSSLWAFVASEGDWYLELYREAGSVDDNGQEIPGGGDIFMNGESLNALNGYDESFGLHLVSDLPFYFFSRDGSYGYVYQGVETPLDYSNISHYGCCSAGLANPRGSEDRVVIFASREDQQYLVMIGDFE